MTETTSTELPVSNAPLEPYQSVLERQNKKAPIEKMSIKSLGELPDPSVAGANGFEQLDSQTSEEFLKSMEPDSTISEEPIEKKKKQKAEKVESTNDFSLDDLDLSKDPEPVVETKGKKSKEDNIAELRKKAEAYEETIKTKDTEVLSYKEKLEKLEAELERTAFERSPKFKNKYETPYNDSVQKASESFLCVQTARYFIPSSSSTRMKCLSSRPRHSKFNGTLLSRLREENTPNPLFLLSPVHR